MNQELRERYQNWNTLVVEALRDLHAQGNYDLDHERPSVILREWLGRPIAVPVEIDTRTPLLRSW